jgi:NAD+ synthase (glutamine-hydrolysing)
MIGFYRISAVVPQLKVGDVDYNVLEIIDAYLSSCQDNCAITVFPELALTGATIGDLVASSVLQAKIEKALLKLKEATAETNNILVVGLPWTIENRIYNVAAVIQSGSIIAFVGKENCQSPRDNNLTRFFSPISKAPVDYVEFQDERIDFISRAVFEAGKDFRFGIAIGEDAFNPNSLCNELALSGALILLNPSATSALAGQNRYLKAACIAQSRFLDSAFVTVNAGVGESTTNGVYSGFAGIYSRGKELVVTNTFRRNTQIIMSSVKPEYLQKERLFNLSYKNSYDANVTRIIIDNVDEVPSLADLTIPKLPFVPTNSTELQSRCEEIFAIQATALAARLERCYAQQMVIGISGGLDSTLALLVCQEACRILDWPTSKILALTMPGFGTTTRTRSNAEKMALAIGCQFKEISIHNAVKQHFMDIEHDPNNLNVVYENSQARERTQILMDVANSLNGIVIGTGDLSEIALGWSTFNGDQMSMYSVNCSVPKTLMRHMVKYCADNSQEELKNVLYDVLATPVSPELLPGPQPTEGVLGSYEVHDFFLYYFYKYHENNENLLTLAQIAFKEEFTQEELKNILKTFMRRFFTQQFKRNASPDGPKTGTVSMGPKGDWVMVSDVSATAWQI